LSGPGPLPTDRLSWERALVLRFLHVDGSGDTSPIRSLEITGETLATVFPDHGAAPDEAEEAFRTAIRKDREVLRALRDGSPHLPCLSHPNCFAYLCASLLIDTLLDGQYSGLGQYRDRLRTWLGTSHALAQLTGLASMWEDLERWLSARAAAGDDLRLLILPDPGRWTQIGYTRRLSFPTRADLRFLTRTLDASGRGVSDVPGLLRQLEAAIDRERVSDGMVIAYREFRDAYRKGGASTGHRFWQLVLRAAAAGGRGDARPAEVRVEIEFDEDARIGFRVSGATATDLASAMRAPAVRTSANLSQAAAQGVVFFRQVGMSRWIAEAAPPAGPAIVGVDARHGMVARGSSVDFQPSGGWLLGATPAQPSAVDDLLGRLRLRTIRSERLVDFGLEAGVHTGGGLLGRRPFLPRVLAPGRKVTVRPLASVSGSPVAVTCSAGTLAARAAVEGRYEVSIGSGAPGSVPEWTRRVRFFRNAVPHDALDAACMREEKIGEWLAADRAVCSAWELPPPEWQAGPEPLADLLEAIYASGRSGLGDPEILDLIHRAAADAVAWDVLRALQEGGVIAARRRARWRGRIWTLEPPRLIRLGRGTVVQGLMCAALEEEFRQVAVGLGAHPFRRRGASDWSPPVVGAFTADPDAVAARLGWSIADPPQAPNGAGAVETSPLLGEHHVQASSWDWDLGRFVTRLVAPGAVSIGRWIHPGGRDHDQYRVRCGSDETRHSTRVGAILQGHLAARRPLFAVEGDALVRTAHEGALPHELAWWLRLRTCSGGGPCSDGGYSYPIGQVPAWLLGRLLPDLIADAGVCPPTGPPPRGSAEPMLLARRSGGRVRVKWSGAELIAS
jgi:hypothetical protein